MPVAYKDPKDHTSEFTATDINENKIIALIPCLIGFLCILNLIFNRSTGLDIISLFRNIKSNLFSVTGTGYFTPALIGIITAHILGGSSQYVKFQNRIAIKFFLFEILVSLIGIVPLIGSALLPVGFIICAVIRFINLIQICKGQAKEPALLSILPFLK